MTAALEGGEWSAARPGRTLPPGKTRYPFYRRLGGPQTRSERAENLVPTGIRSRTVQPIVAIPTELPGPPRVLRNSMNCEEDVRLWVLRVSSSVSCGIRKEVSLVQRIISLLTVCILIYAVVRL